jgi:Ni,Fe-hydrogenase III component G
MTEDFEARMKEAFPSSEVTLGTNGRFWVALKPEELVPAVDVLRNKFSMIQLAVIVGEDMRDSFLANYIFTGERIIVLQVRMDHDKPEVPSLAAIIPGAIVYERELKDMFGIIPVGHPDLRRQAVPEDWPEGVYPLRKDWKFERNAEAVEQEIK